MYITLSHICLFISQSVSINDSSEESVPIYRSPHRIQIEQKVTKSPPQEPHLIKQNRVLLKIESVFPFDFFTDTLIIDENKVSIYISNFFFSNDIRSFAFKDIQFVEVMTSVLFASLGIKVFGFPHDEIVIRYLLKKDAHRARRLIQGLMEASKSNIDFSGLSVSALIRQAELLGSSHGASM